MTAQHAPDAGGQLQPLVRQPQAPRNETARAAHHLALEPGRPEARRAAAQREPMRTRRAGAGLARLPTTPACNPDPRRRRTPHTAEPRRAWPRDALSETKHLPLGGEGARPRDRAARAARGSDGNEDRRSGVHHRHPVNPPSRNAAPNDARRRPRRSPGLPHTTDREAGRRTANGQEDPARYATDPTSKSSSIEERLFGLPNSLLSCRLTPILPRARAARQASQRSGPRGVAVVLARGG